MWKVPNKRLLSHFIDEDTENERGYFTCLWSHNKPVARGPKSFYSILMHTETVSLYFLNQVLSFGSYASQRSLELLSLPWIYTEFPLCLCIWMFMCVYQCCVCVHWCPWFWFQPLSPFWGRAGAFCSAWTFFTELKSFSLRKTTVKQI